MKTLVCIHERNLELLRLLLEATQSGRVVWQHDRDEDVHRACVADVKCSIEFKHPLLAGDKGSEADGVEVVVGQVGLTLYGGSEGYDLISEILAAAYPENREWMQMCAQNLDETIGRLREALKEGGSS